MDVEDPDPMIDEHAGDDDDGDDDGDDDDQQLLLPPSTPETAGTAEEAIPMASRRTTSSGSYRERVGTAETSFIEGGAVPAGGIVRDGRILLARKHLKSLYPRAAPKLLSKLEVVEVRRGSRKGTQQVMVVGPRGGRTPLYAKDGSINQKLPKMVTDLLGPTREALANENEGFIRELEEDIAKDEQTANDENESGSIRERARKRVDEGREHLAKLEVERESLEERMPLRERLKTIFKKYGFTLVAVALAVGTTIGVIVSSLTNGLKTVASGVGNGFKALGKKLAAILPGLLGSIVGFVFRAAGEVVKFLGENAWLLILAVVAFMLERRRVKRD